MMKGKFRSSSLLLSSVLSLAPAYCIANRSDCKEDSIASSSNKKDSSHDIAVYLNTASRSELSAYLRKYGVEGDVDTSRVVVRRSCSSRDSYFYEPLFGERAAFRLKGLVKTESGSIAGVGRVSTLTGELIDDDCDPSIVLKNAENSSASHGIDLPTRLSLMQVDKDWKGDIVAGIVLEESYPSEAGDYHAIPSENQLVVAGILCNSLYVDKDGNCSFDRTVDMQHSGAPIPSHEEINSNSTPGKNSKKNRENAAKNVPQPENEYECPVCKYMKGGECKKHFETWEECVESIGDSDDLTKCFDITMDMMKCMRANEYYDIMTAGTEEKYAAAENATALAKAGADAATNSSAATDAATDAATAAAVAASVTA